MSITIYREDGVKVLNFIKSELGIRLPKSGFLAGQSVCSILMFIKGIEKEVHVNDIDIFHMSNFMLNDLLHMSNSKLTIGLPHVKNASYSFINKRKYKDYTDKNGYYAELFKSNKITKEEYLGLLISPDYKVKMDISLFNTPEWNTKDSLYTIRRVFRDGLLNHVLVENDYGDLPSIINGFDLNNTQVGICLATGEISFTYSFLKFMNTRELKIINRRRPYHALIRYFSKIDEFKYSGNDEMEVLSASMSMHMSEKNIANYINESLFPIEDFWISSLDGSEPYSSISINRFGDTYLPKYRSVSRALSDFSIDTEVINNYYDCENTENLKETSQLSSFSPRIPLEDCLDIDAELKRIKNKVGKPILGGNRLLFLNSRNIVERNNGMASEKTYSSLFLPALSDANEVERLSYLYAGSDNANEISKFINENDNLSKLLLSLSESERSSVISRFSAGLSNVISDNEKISKVFSTISLCDYKDVHYSDNEFEYTPVSKLDCVNDYNFVSDNVRGLYLGAILNYNFAWILINKKTKSLYLYGFGLGRAIRTMNSDYKRDSYKKDSFCDNEPVYLTSERYYRIPEEDTVLDAEFESSVLKFKDWLSTSGNLTQLINSRI